MGCYSRITHHWLIAKRLAAQILAVKLVVESAIELAIELRAQLILQLIVFSTVCRFCVTYPSSCWALENHVLVCLKHAYTGIVVRSVKLIPNDQK